MVQKTKHVLRKVERLSVSVCTARGTPRTQSLKLGHCWIGSLWLMEKGIGCKI